MKREQHPWISASAENVLVSYREALQERDELRAATIRNYLSDLRHFMAWCETSWQEGLFPEVAFRLPDLTTPLIAQYRAYLLSVLRLKPASINRMLVSIKRFSAWATERDMLASDPARHSTGRAARPAASVLERCRRTAAPHNSRDRRPSTRSGHRRHLVAHRTARA
jgi:site-specific recombinase XerD